MLRLWPRRIHAGLFPDQCWLRGGVAPAAAPASGATKDLLQAFDAMLLQNAKQLGRGARLVVTVTDSLAAIATLPWQQELSRADELDAYARSCFEHQGMALDESWAMLYDFRRFGEAGLAYALPVSLLDALAKIVSKHGMTLASVLPVSVVAYGQSARSAGAASSVILLREAQRCSALVFDATGLTDYTIEPATRSHAESAQRLLTRIGSRNEVAAVYDWSAGLQQEAEAAAVVTRIFPKAMRTALGRDAWN